MKLNPANSSIIKRLLVGRNNRPLLSILARVEPADLASMMSSLNARESRLLVEALMSISRAIEVLKELPEPQMPQLFLRLNPETRVQLIEAAKDEEGAYFLSLLNEGERIEILEAIEPQRRERIQQFLDYPEDSAGRLMQTDVFSVNAELTAAQGLDQLRSKAQEQSIYYIYCVSDENKLIGVVSLRALATAPPNTRLGELIKRDVVFVKPETSSEEVAQAVSHYDFIAIPVVDSNRCLVGIVTVDDVLDIIQEQATANIYAQAGLQEDDRVFSPALESFKNRLPWMFLNLILAALASSVVSLFEETMSQLIILASLKNIVAGIGGNTAIQTLTVVTRGIATGDFSFISHAKAILKETTVGVSIGLMTGFSAAVLTYFWKGSLLVSVVIFISMVLNSLVASTFGALIPITLKKFNWDPAVGSGVLVTMITDIFGFFSFLGIAALGLSLVS